MVQDAEQVIKIKPSQFKGNLFILMTSFSIGLLIDLGSNTLSDVGPLHGFSCLVLGYFRPNFIKIISSRINNLNDFIIQIDYFDQKGIKKRKNRIPLKYILNNKFI